MEGHGAGHGVPAAALLAILASALLIPETSSLQCHSHSSVLLHDRGGKRLDSVVTPKGTESCTPTHSACMEAAVTLRAGGMSVTLIQRGCRDGNPKGGTEPPARPSRFLHIQADVRYCQSDQCNAKGLDLGSPGQGTAPAPSGPTQCYAGLSLGPQPHTLERVTCDGDDTRCYHGNGTLTAGKLTVPIFMWSCQAPSCAMPPSRHFGPLQLSQAGACCSGSYCNGQGALAPVSLGHKISSGHVPTGIPGYSLLAHATARKGHKHPGRSHSTAATELPYLDHTDYNDSMDLLNPNYEGDTPHSTRPRTRPTEPGNKNSYPTSTVRPSHKHPNPQSHSSQAPSLRLCPLLVVLGIALAGLGARTPGSSLQLWEGSGV
ncbi:ly6/PLAUR domain-containing protein 5-like isoform X2 [Dermochelys coriacea]|uniref:ly6/PLAUR domain-containing protein 5-like isoform X2 n=1 Tax=Dermochelys coriacea TaxID=27794 RepID=UPI0018E79FE6|nr:ly6/PLAUR domain-containing protein 5-like isoform X2 [Dermochelys coriacea]